MIDDDKTVSWVRRLNALARKMDKACARVHTSAWPELTAKDRAEYRRIAAEGPKP